MRIVLLIFAGLAWQPAQAGQLSEAEAEALGAEVASLVIAFERGDVQHFINKTYSPAVLLAGGVVMFAVKLQRSLAELEGVEILAFAVGAPTPTYYSGDEEVSFVPMEKVMEYRGRRVRSRTFMVAVRSVDGGDWSFFEGGALRERPDALYFLLPQLERDIELPPNFIEELDAGFLSFLTGLVRGPLVLGLLLFVATVVMLARAVRRGPRPRVNLTRFHGILRLTRSGVVR